MMTRRWVVAAWFMGVVLPATTPPARADDAARPVRLVYEVHPGCPDALYFVWSAQQRSSRLRPALPGENGATVNVTIEEKNGQSAGTLDVSGNGAVAFTRDVEASTCAEVVQAMALMLALAFDPDAIDPAPAPAPASPVTPAAVRRVVVPVAAPREERAAAGLEGAIASGLGPSLRPLFGVFVAYQSLRHSLIRPRVEVSLLIAPEHEFEATSGHVTLGFFGGKLSACPVGFPFAAGKLEAMPCVAFAAGRLTGEGDPALPIQHVESRFWSALFAQASLRWGVTERLFLQASAAVGVTLTRAEFVLDGARAYRVPPLAGELALGAGVHF